MNSSRDKCFWIGNASKLRFWDSFSRRFMILKFKVSKRCSVKQWEKYVATLKIKQKVGCPDGASSSQWRLLGLVRFFAFGWEEFACVLCKKHLREAISSERLKSIIQTWKHWHHFLTWVPFLVLVKRLIYI